MSKTLKAAFKFVIFLLIFIMLFDFFETLLMDKHSYGKYRSWKVQEDVDIIFMGNSHAECAIDTVELEEYLLAETGSQVFAFNYGVYGMRMEQLYFFYKEIIKTNQPELIVLDTFVFCPLADRDREILARRAFDPFPLSLNKIQGINYCVLEDHWSYYFPLAKYHSRWKELMPYDYSYIFSDKDWKDTGRKLTVINDVMPDPGDGWFEQELPPVSELREPTADQKECFEKFLALLEEQGVELLLVNFPYRDQMGMDAVENVKINNYLLENYVNGESIKMLDMNRLWEELDMGYSDLYDSGHLNRTGADKVSALLFPYLKDNYDIPSYAG